MDHDKNTENAEQTIEQLFKRDEDGNLCNEGLNNYESDMFLKLQKAKLNCDVGESVVEDFEEHLKNALRKTLEKAVLDFYTKKMDLLYY